VRFGIEGLGDYGIEELLKEAIVFLESLNP
jgi:hypothetical protein